MNFVALSFVLIIGVCSFGWFYDFFTGSLGFPADTFAAPAISALMLGSALLQLLLIILGRLRGDAGIHQEEVVVLTRHEVTLQEAFKLRYPHEKGLTNDDIIELVRMKPVDNVTMHEAGHAVVAHECGLFVLELRVRSEGMSYCAHALDHLSANHNNIAVPFLQAAVAMAGKAAEPVSSKVSVGWEDDYHKAAGMLMAYAADRHLPYDKVVANAQQLVEDILDANQDRVRELADLALQDLDRIVSVQDIHKVLVDRRGDVVFDEEGYAHYQLVK